MSVDTIGNFLTVIRNGLLVSKRSVQIPHSNMREAIAQILVDEGFVKRFEVDASDKNKPQLTVHLKYVNGESVIHELTRVSSPGRRQYSKIKNVKGVIGGLGINILTTNAGVMTDKKARKLSVGGEIICRVW
jgi:small subunit ribosomal protein S8